MAPSPYIFIISIGPVDMNKYARFDEIPSMTLKGIKETKRYGRTDRRTDGWTDGQRENSIPTHKHSLRGGGYKNNNYNNNNNHNDNNRNAKSTIQYNSASTPIEVSQRFALNIRKATKSLRLCEAFRSNYT